MQGLVYAALQATASSGLRTIFCYCPTARVSSMVPFKAEQELFPDWFMETFDKLAKLAPFGAGQVTLGFAIDALFMPGAFLKSLYKRVRNAPVDLITLHGMKDAMFGSKSSLFAAFLRILELRHQADGPSAFHVLEQNSLLGPDILISHANNPDPSDAALMRNSGASISGSVSIHSVPATRFNLCDRFLPERKCANISPQHTKLRAPNGPRRADRPRPRLLLPRVVRHRLP